MQEITLDKYVELNEKYASYDNDGYYIDPIIILIMVADNLRYGLSFDELKEFVKKIDVVISKQELDQFLLQKRKKDKKTSTSERGSESFFTLEYFKDYLARRKKKCATLFEIYEDMEAVREEKELSAESVERLNTLNIHFNDYRYVYYEDALRLARTIVFNVRDLYEKGSFANALDFYWNYRVTNEFLLDCTVTDEFLSAEEQKLEIIPEKGSQPLEISTVKSDKSHSILASKNVKTKKENH